MAYDPNRYMFGPKKLGVSGYMNARQHGPNTSNVTDPRTGQRLSLQEAQALGPLYHSGWNTSGVGPGTRGYRGSYYNGGYNYGEGTRRPTARDSSEYYSTRDHVVGNPLLNLRRFGPGRFFGGGGGSIIDRVQAEVRGSAAADPVWSTTMSGGPTTLPPAASNLGNSPYGTKIENGVEVPMTAEDLNKVRGSISSVVIPGVGRSEFAPERNTSSFRPPTSSPQPPPPINTAGLAPQFLPSFMQASAPPAASPPELTENSGIIPPQMVQSTFLPMKNADLPQSQGFLVTPWQKLNLEVYKAASNTVKGGRDWVRDKLNWLSRPQYTFTP